jgi:hypothetical protein
VISDTFFTAVALNKEPAEALYVASGARVYLYNSAFNVGKGGKSEFQWILILSTAKSVVCQGNYFIREEGNKICNSSSSYVDCGAHFA